MRKSKIYTGHDVKNLLKKPRSENKQASKLKQDLRVTKSNQQRREIIPHR